MQSTNCFTFKPIQNKKIQQALEKNKKELDKFFNVDYLLPKVFLINSRKDFDIYKGYKTPNWLSGTANGNVIYVVHPDKYTKITSHKNINNFWKLIKHEHCHLYYRSFVKTCNPVWLNEGLCFYLAQQGHKKDNINLFLKVVDLKKHENWQKMIYSIGYYWVNFLIENFGKEKFFKLLKEISKNDSEKHFKQIFYKIYKIKFTKTDLKKLILKYNKKQK